MPPVDRRHILRTAVAGTVALANLAAGPRTAPGRQAAAPDPSIAARRATLAHVRSWGYQLRLINFAEVAASPFDLVVLDHGLSGGRRFIRQFEPHEIAPARTKPGGSRRIVLSYLSIGEAERYRFYWDHSWHDPAQKPPWIEEMNPLWDGNYKVRFWEPAWQRLMYGSPEAYLERVIAQGFDGVYLDRVDAFLDWQALRPAAESEMVDFVVRLAAHARRLNPDFLVVMQNAEELVAEKSLREAIDGIAKEDLFHGIDHTQAANKPDDIAHSLRFLRQARADGHLILVVEYLADPALIEAARRRIAAYGFVAYFAPRSLYALVIDPIVAFPRGPPPPPSVPSAVLPALPRKP